VSCNNNTDNNDSITSSEISAGNDINPRPINDAKRPERPQDLFTELLHVHRTVVQHEDGFYVFATTLSEPDDYQFYFCNITDESVTLFSQTLTDELYVSTFQAMSDGSLLVAGWSIEKTLDASDFRIDDSSIRVYQVKNKEATLLTQLSDVGVWSIAVDEQKGQMYVQVIRRGEDSIFVYSLTGVFLYETAFTTPISSIIFSEQDRKLYIMQSSGSDMSILYLDESNKQLQEVAILPDGAAGVMFFHGRTHSFYAVHGLIVFGYDSDSGQFTRLFDLTRHGISGWVPFIMEYDSQYLVCAVDMMTGETRISLLTMTDEYEGPVETLRLGKFELGRDYFIEELISNFNFTYPQYIIEIVDYSVFDNEATTRLHLDIIMGNAPDIFLLSGTLYGEDLMPVHYYLPIHQYIASGILVDLAPYMHRDLDFNDYLENAMQALYINDTSYFAVPSFSLYTITGKSEVMDTLNNIDFSELLELLKNDFESGNNKFISNLTQSDFVKDIVLTNINQFVDYRTGEAYFNTEKFILLLETANLYKASYDWDKVALARGLGQFTFSWINYISDIELLEVIYNGDLQASGFPGTPPGTVMVPAQMFGISSTTQNIEGAWAFIREMYEYRDMHNLYRSHIPMNKYSFMLSLEKYIKSTTEIITLLNEEGEEYGHLLAYYEDDGTDLSVYLPTLTIDQVDVIARLAKDIIEQIDRIYIIDNALINIIKEELPAFFIGNRTASDTARVIQSRTQIYLSEMVR